MLRSCLPDAFGSAGRVYDLFSPAATLLPGAVDNAGPDTDGSGSESSDDEGWGQEGPGDEATAMRRNRSPPIVAGGSNVSEGETEDETVGDSDRGDDAFSSNVYVNVNANVSDRVEGGKRATVSQSSDVSHIEVAGLPPGSLEVGDAGVRDQRKSSAGRVQRLSLDKDVDGDSDVVDKAGRLTAALRLQRLLYGLAKLHLRGLGERQTRVLLAGLSAGLNYARAFHARQELRTALFHAG